MSTRTLLNEEDACDTVKAVFEDIRQTRNTSYINNFWRALAHDPEQLKATWQELKAVMGPGKLDPLTKELIYVAVSAANNCSYCIHSHTAAARSKGMNDEQYNEFLSILTMAGKTNALATSLQVPIDDTFMS